MDHGRPVSAGAGEHSLPLSTCDVVDSGDAASAGEHGSFTGEGMGLEAAREELDGWLRASERALPSTDMPALSTDKLIAAEFEVQRRLRAELEKEARRALARLPPAERLQRHKRALLGRLATRILTREFERYDDAPAPFPTRFSSKADFIRYVQAHELGEKVSFDGLNFRTGHGKAAALARLQAACPEGYGPADEQGARRGTIALEEFAAVLREFAVPGLGAAVTSGGVAACDAAVRAVIESMGRRYCIRQPPLPPPPPSAAEQQHQRAPSGAEGRVCYREFVRDLLELKQGGDGVAVGVSTAEKALKRAHGRASNEARERRVDTADAVHLAETAQLHQQHGCDMSAASGGGGGGVSSSNSSGSSSSGSGASSAAVVGHCVGDITMHASRRAGDVAGVCAGATGGASGLHATAVAAHTAAVTSRAARAIQDARPEAGTGPFDRHGKVSREHPPETLCTAVAVAFRPFPPVARHMKRHTVRGATR